MQSPMQLQQPPGQPFPPPGTPVWRQPPNYPPPPVGYALPYPPYPPVKRRAPWWWQALALLLTPCIALIVGYPVLGLCLWVTYGDSPTPPPHADQAAGWLIATYVGIGVLCGLGLHAIVIRNPKLFLAGLVVTVGIIGGMVWAYTRLF